MLILLVLALLGYIGYAMWRGTAPADDEGEGGAAARPKCILPTIPEYVEEDEGTSPRALISKTVESLDWLNDIMRSTWPHVCKIVEKELGPNAEPLINAALPSPLKNFKFVQSNLGQDSLVVDRVTVHKRYKDSIALDLDVSFRGKPDIAMSVSPLAGVFGVDKLVWSGRLCVLMRPLTTTLPCIGAVQAAFVDHPHIDLDFSGVASFADFGPVERVIRKVMRDVVAAMFVLPNRLVFKLNDTVDFFDVYYPPAGAIIVSCIEGRGFVKERKAKFVKLTPDVYCKLKFGLEKTRTKTVKKSLTPEWNHSKMFVLYDDDQPLEIKSMDDDPVHDDLLGEVRILAKKLVEDNKMWVKFDKIHDPVAANAEILIQCQPMGYTKDLTGSLMVTVLIDRAVGLAAKTNSSYCKVSIGGHDKNARVEKQSAMVVRPEEPIPLVDPSNPIFMMAWDVIVPTLDDANVSISLYQDKRSVGKIHFGSAVLEAAARGDVASPTSGNDKDPFTFKLPDSNATIRCKVLVRGLVADKKPTAHRPDH